LVAVEPLTFWWVTIPARLSLRFVLQSTQHGIKVQTLEDCGGCQLLLGMLTILLNSERYVKHNLSNISKKDIVFSLISEHKPLINTVVMPSLEIFSFWLLQYLTDYSNIGFRCDIRGCMMILKIKEVATRQGIKNAARLSKLTGIGLQSCYQLWDGSAKGIQFETLNTLCNALQAGPALLLEYVPDVARGGGGSAPVEAESSATRTAAPVRKQSRKARALGAAAASSRG
jgi:DNA-binding Xre family transcriptional regulator